MVLVGGGVDRAVHDATVGAAVPTNVRPFRHKLFGADVAVTATDDLRGCCRTLQPKAKGLGASTFTRDIPSAMPFVREVDAGVVHINWNPLWRIDPMPYGGFKGSGIGKEGTKCAIEAMTDVKTIVAHR